MMTGTESLTDGRDIIDSRDVIARIEELEAPIECTCENTGELAPHDSDCPVPDGLSDEDREELAALVEFREELANYLPDWQYGEALIREDYFTDYAMELIEECGYISKDFPGWIAIDWEKTAEAVRMDYTSGELNGVTYWGRM